MNIAFLQHAYEYMPNNQPLGIVAFLQQVHFCDYSFLQLIYLFVYETLPPAAKKSEMFRHHNYTLQLFLLIYPVSAKILPQSLIISARIPVWESQKYRWIWQASKPILNYISRQFASC